MKPRYARIGRSLVLRWGGLAYIRPISGASYWINEMDSTIGVADPATDETTWWAPSPNGWKVVRIRKMTIDQYQLIEAATLVR